MAAETACMCGRQDHTTMAKHKGVRSIDAVGGADASAASHEANCGEGGQAMGAQVHRWRMEQVAALGEAAKDGYADNE